MGFGPRSSGRKGTQKVSMNIKDMELIEFNEAFGSVFVSTEGSHGNLQCFKGMAS